MSGIADSPEHESEPGRWETARSLYPYLSVLLFAPVCLILGWWWLALGLGVVGMGIVLRYFPPRGFIFLPLLVWNLGEAVLALNLIVFDWRERLKATTDAAQ